MKNVTKKESGNGILVQAVGPIIDVRFPDGVLPSILTALYVELEDRKLVLEVAQHVGDDTARCVAMAPTEGHKYSCAYFSSCWKCNFRKNV